MSALESALEPVVDYFAARPWMRFARCSESGPAAGEAWFPKPGDNAGSGYAVRVCRRCPVQNLCLEDALSSGDAEWGIRGGVSPRARRRMLQERAAAELGVAA